MDYFSHYPEVMKLSSTTSGGVINALKSIFGRHGIPEALISDNGPQFNSHEFEEKYDIRHETSSPHYPQSNGQAERCVQTIKNILQKSADPYLGLLSYRSTSLAWCNKSPAELLMGRNLRTTIPVVRENLVPQWPYLESFRKENLQFKRKPKECYDR